MLDAAVIGAGHQGRFHALKYARMPGVRLVAVVDVNPERARRVAAEAGAAACVDHREVLGRVQVASVAVPVSAHGPVGRDLLSAGVHVLMEKPVAATVAEARSLIALAAARRRILQVGHLERFNPVVRALAARIRRPRFLEAHRLARYNARSTDADVVLDLMIHDLDLTLMLAGAAPINAIEASGTSVFSDRIDVANARLRFENGCVASLTASRAAPVPQRLLRSYQRDAYLCADMSGHVLEWCRRVSGPAAARGWLEGGRQALPRGDALRDQIEAFLHAVRTGRPPPVDAESGVRALEAALDIVKQIDRQRAAAPPEDLPPRRVAST